MTPDERNMLADLANKLAQTPAPPKDAEAEDFIRQRIGSRPDALYLMTQTVLIQNLALRQAQEQIQQLQQPRAQPAMAAGGSFLGQQPQYANPAPQYAQSQYAAPSQTIPSPSGAGSFLRGAAQTAAGVAAGALAFEGISSLFSHSGYGGGFGGGSPVEETVVNNYYDSPQGERHGEQLANDTQRDDANQQDDNAQYDDANYDSSDDSGSDDNSGDSFA